MADRTIRAVCSEKPDYFLSTQKGYKRVDFATTAELEESIAGLHSRINEIRRRADALERVLQTREDRNLGLELT